MKPRLSSSTKWTQFPVDFTQLIHDVFQQSFKDTLSKGKLIVEGRIYPAEIILRVGYLENGRLKQANFEVSMDMPPGDDKTMDLIHVCIDAAGSMLQEYITNDGEVDFPLVWQESPFDGAKIWHQFTTENSALEAEANRLLGIAESESLVADDNLDSEEALDRAEILETEDLKEVQKKFQSTQEAVSLEASPSNLLH